MPPTSHIKTLIVEDHEMMLHGLTTYLTEFIPLVEVVATATSADEALQVVTTHSLDLIIMDIYLKSKPNGLDLTEELNKQFPEIAILIHSTDTNIELVRRAQQAGARGYINKGAGKEIFKKAIDVVTKGGTYLPKLDQEVEELTKSEKKVMKLLAQDKKDADVATELAIIAKPLFTDSNRGGFVGSCGHAMLIRFAPTGGRFCSRWWQQGRSGSAVSGG
ncbi:MAG: response regulator transcription factor [Nitrospira sp.]|nr:response regulator transcription factor [Nitrospira sp.]